jgi:AcrR family transcriptional regulator
MTESNQKPDTRQRILDAAREVFFREDYMGASVDEIASAAQISKGAVYRHFSNKAALYVSVLGEESRHFFEYAEQRAERTAGLGTAERVRRLWSDYVNHWHRNPDAFRIFWAIDNRAIIGELPAEMAESVQEYWRRSLTITQRVFDEGVRRGELIPVDTWQAAQAFWALATVLIDQDNVKERRRIRGVPFRELYDFGIELLLRGMLADPSESLLPPEAGPDADGSRS